MLFSPICFPIYICFSPSLQILSFQFNSISIINLLLIIYPIIIIIKLDQHREKVYCEQKKQPTNQFIL